MRVRVRVGVRVGVGEQRLACALGDNDDTMALGEDTRLHVAQQASVPFELEGHFGHQAHVDTTRSDRRVSRDEARVATWGRGRARVAVQFGLEVRSGFELGLGLWCDFGSGSGSAHPSS